MIVPLILTAVLASPASTPPTSASPASDQEAAVASVALRVHRVDAMLRFYSDAFGIEFETVETPDFTMYEGRLGSVLVKLVPIRDEVDFEGFAVHQIGFTVPDVGRVVALAEEAGGLLIEHRASASESGEQAAIRDPDGNSVELYGP